MAFSIKQNDTRPPYVVALLNDYRGPSEAALPLTNADTIRFLMRLKGEPDGSTPKVDGAMTVVGSPALGVVSYEWQAADTNAIGDYEVEVEITWNDGGIETVPNDGYFDLEVLDDLG